MDRFEDEPNTLNCSCFISPNRCTKRLLHLSDIIVSSTIITPLVIAYWFGTWGFIDNHPEYFPIITTLLFGAFLHLLLVLTRYHVHDQIKRPEHKDKTLTRSIWSFLFTKFYIYVFSIACILVWRAIWAISGEYGKTSNKLLSNFKFMCIYN